MVSQALTEQATLSVVKTNLFDHKVHAGDKLIARIKYDPVGNLIQRWLAIVNGEVVHSANTWKLCYSYITSHYKQGSLPVQEQAIPVTITDNEVMAQVAAECEQVGFELLGDGVHQNDQRLGEVGCTDGQWWVTLIRNSQFAIRNYYPPP